MLVPRIHQVMEWPGHYVEMFAESDRAFVPTMRTTWEEGSMALTPIYNQPRPGICNAGHS